MGDGRFGRYNPTKKKQISAIAAVDYTAYDVTRSVTYFRNRKQEYCSMTSISSTVLEYVLPERDYVTFGSLLSQIRLSVVCL